MLKKLYFIIFLVWSSIIYSQEHFPIGVHYNIGNSNIQNLGMFNITIDNISNSYVFGIEAGFGGSTSGEDYTEVINIDQYSSDRIGTYSFTSWNMGLRVGKTVYKNINLLGTVGYLNLSKYEDRYDNYNILGNNGSYVVLNKSKNSAYLKLSASYRINKLIPEVSFGTTGIQIGCSFLWL